MKIFIFMFFASAMFLTSCAPLKIQSNSMKHSIIIDGKSEDWADIPMCYNDKPPFMMGAVNDSSQIIIVLIFRDPLLAQSLLRRGFSVWLDQDKNYQIDYMANRDPLNSKNNIAQYRLNPLQKGNNSHPLRSRDFTAIIQQPESYIALQEIEHLNAAFSFENGNYCLELQIPIKKNGDVFGIPILSGDYAEIELATKEANKQPVGKRPDIKPSGMRGGGGRRGGGYGNGKNRMAAYREAGMHLKTVIQLAQ